MVPLLSRILKEMYLDYTRILNFIFPPSADEQCIAHTQASYIRQLTCPKVGVHATSLLPYTDAQIKALVHLAKFQSHTRAQKLLAVALQQYLSILTTRTILVPVPLSSKRKRTRGYNQVEEVIKYALQLDARTAMAHTLNTNILKRTRHTHPQTSLSKAQRLTNVQNAFAVCDIQKAKSICDNRHVILIDDVITTGATLTAAKDALIQIRPLSITCIALAH